MLLLHSIPRAPVERGPLAGQRFYRHVAATRPTHENSTTMQNLRFCAKAQSTVQNFPKKQDHAIFSLSPASQALALIAFIQISYARLSTANPS